MPLRDVLCLVCGFQTEVLIRSPEDQPDHCFHCASTKVELLPSLPGGYQIHGSNSASTRPKNSGSFKKGKR